MNQVNSFKQLKEGLNCYPSKAPVQKQNSIKKKPFARKPAPNNPSVSSQNKRKMGVAIEGIKTAKSINQSPSKDRLFIQAPSNMVQITRKQRQTENFYKDKELVNQFRRKYEKEMIYTSKSQKNLLESAIRPNNLNKKQLNQINFNNQFKRKTETSKAYGRVKQTLETSGLIDQASDNDSVQYFKENKSASNTSEKAISFKRFLSPNFAGYRDKLEEKVQTRECFYCKNNKLIVDILTEKQRKLEDQYMAKTAAVKQFMEKCDLLKQENRILINKMDKNVQIFQAKETYFYRDKEELIARMETLKRDCSKLNQKLKYEQIQNSILLRYKDQYQLMTQQFDHLRHDNQILKRQIAAYQNQNRFNFSKGKKKTDNGKKYQFYNKIVSPPNQKRKYSREDDEVSLNFSEQSFQIV